MRQKLLQLQRDELNFLSLKKLETIIQSKTFYKLPKDMQNKILDLRDLIDRY